MPRPSTLVATSGRVDIGEPRGVEANVGAVTGPVGGGRAEVAVEPCWGLSVAIIVVSIVVVVVVVVLGTTIVVIVLAASSVISSPIIDSIIAAAIVLPPPPTTRGVAI